VVERTRQLMAANQELEQEIVKNHELANKLAARNHDLMDSINYARHIQDALFPAANDIPFFSASACMSMPRDVVSGDFVWHYETATHLLLAVADCTGHGVPGALMSMLGHSLLNQLVVERHLVAPADILTAMDEAVSALFTKYTTDEHVNDGLDMGLISVEKGTRQLHFSGALIACDLIRDGALRHLPGGRSPLGGYRWPKSKEFLDVQVPLLPGDRLVMHTDGYQSQFGGPNDRKLNGRGLRELLVRSAPMPPVAATEFLSAEFNAWKGDTEQVDDVLVMVLDV
jgi:serine phosphatase RsbU (regulator of sigma subunit)